MGWAEAMAVDVNNHPSSAADKSGLRRRVLAAIPGASVFDAFAGAGRMWRSVWRNAAAYVGCDLKWYRDRDRMAYVGDNRRVLRAIDLAGFNLFDLDSYRSPWDCALIIADRRAVATGELIGIVLTDGSLIGLKLGKTPNALAELAGIASGARGMSHQYHQIIDRAVSALCERMRCDVVQRWQAQGQTQAGVMYIGLVLRGRAIVRG